VEKEDSRGSRNLRRSVEPQALDASQNRTWGRVFDTVQTPSFVTCKLKESYCYWRRPFLVELRGVILAPDGPIIEKK
jgi:hypothetical protein